MQVQIAVGVSECSTDMSEGMLHENKWAEA